jgi:alpha-beta hydrolase superfamily lysophospholipase
MAAWFRAGRAWTWAAALALTACGAGPVGGPVPASRADVSRGAVQDGVDERLVMHGWPSRGPTRAVILGLHGFGDAGALTFADAAEYWTGRGISVYAVDQRGFGGNASRKRWPGVDALVADAVEVAAQVRGRHPGRPLVIVGHSMGGGVALAAAAAGMQADALVLAGPAIAGGDALNPLYRAGGWTLAAVAPERRWTGRGVVDIRPTDNDDALREVAADPRHFGDPSSRELYGLVLLMDRAAAAAPAVHIPTLTLMGAHDEVLEPRNVRRIHVRIPGAVGFKDYPDGWHWLFRDHQAERVWRDVADFALGIAAERG